MEWAATALGVWVLGDLLRLSGLSGKVLAGVLGAALVLAWIARWEQRWWVGVGGLLLGAILLGSLVAVGPTLPHCMSELGPEVAFTPCMADEAHQVMALGARLGGAVGLVLTPLLLWVRCRSGAALDRSDPDRLVLGAWLAVLGAVHVNGATGGLGWGALGGALLLVALPTAAAWRGTRWLRRVYAGAGGRWWVDMEKDSSSWLPLLTAGQLPHRSDARLMRAAAPGDPYRDTAAPRAVARVCSSLQLQLRPLQRRTWLGVALLSLIAGLGLARLGTRLASSCDPETPAPAGPPPSSAKLDGL